MIDTEQIRRAAVAPARADLGPLGIADVWAVRPATLRAIAARVRATTVIHAAARAAPAGRAGDIAVIPIRGPLEQHRTMLSDLIGGTGLDGVQAEIVAAASDPGVASIVLDIDSPGGEVYGVTETAAVIREARNIKPVVAVANSLAASAAYWLAASADAIAVTPSGEVGSIGVLAVHEDVSQAMDQLGVTISLVSAGEFKSEGTPFQPLEDVARDELQRRVDGYYGSFVRDVAAGRGVTESIVRDAYGEGRIVAAGEALTLGMVDRIDPLPTVLDSLAARDWTPGSPPARFGIDARRRRSKLHAHISYNKHS